MSIPTAVRVKLVADPKSVISIASSNLDRWEKSYGFTPGWMTGWRAILDGGVVEILRVIDGTDERSILLRSSSPFAGVLTEDERSVVYGNYKST